MSEAGECWGVFGGSFNPPHVGHVLAVSYALSVHALDGVLVIPVFQHPFAKELAPYEDRLEMARLAMGWLPRVIVSDVERRIGGDSRTLFTVEALLAERPDRTLRLIIGADVLADAPKWHRFDRLTALAPPIVLGRAGVAEPLAPPPLLPAVSSSEIRAALARSDGAAVARLVPRSVLAYVGQRGLYQGTGA